MLKPWIQHYDPHVSPTIEYPPVPLTRILDDTADHFPGALAVFFFGGKIRYGTLRAEANQFAAALQGMGFKKGERLGILLPNMPQAIISTFGALKAGGTAVFFDPLADKEDLRQQIHHAGIETLVVLDLVLPRVDSVFAQSKLKNFIICRVKDYLPFPQNYLFSLAARGKGLNIKVAKKPNIHLFREFLARVPPNSSVSAGGEGGSAEVAVIQYQRGPAGGPQGIMFSHKSLIAGIHQISAWMGPIEKGREVFLSILPCHQIDGLTLAMNLPIFLGAVSVHLPQFEITRALSAIGKHRISFFPATPQMVESIGNYLLVDKKRVSSVERCLAVGPELTEEMILNFEKRTGRKVTRGYAPPSIMTLTHAHPVAGKHKDGSIGLLLPDTEAKILDPGNREKEMPVGEAGEMVVRGPQLMQGYVDMPEETGNRIRDGWLYSGERARMDEDGFFYILGK